MDLLCQLGITWTCIDLTVWLQPGLVLINDHWFGVVYFSVKCTTVFMIVFNSLICLFNMGSKCTWFCDRRHLEKLGDFCILANWETLSLYCECSITLVAWYGQWLFKYVLVMEIS